MGLKRLTSSIGGKLIYVTSFLSILLTEAGILIAPSIIFYFFTVTILPLFLYRLVTYWKVKQQLFLLDSCYCVNILTLVVIWAAPHSKHLLMLQFGFSHGAVLWAPLIYRNSLVLDDIDRVTSAYIHVYPPLIAYLIRWFPEKSSIGWHQPFIQLLPQNTTLSENILQVNSDPDMWLWIFCIPMIIYNCVMMWYAVFIKLVWEPSDEFLDSYAYMAKRTDCIGEILRKFSGKKRIGMNLFAFMFVGSVQYLVTPGFYCLFVLNSIAIGVQQLLIVWNGATYQIDVYKRALKEKEKKRSQDSLSTNNKAAVSNNHNEEVTIKMKGTEDDRILKTTDFS